MKSPLLMHCSLMELHDGKTYPSIQVVNFMLTTSSLPNGLKEEAVFAMHYS